MPGPIAATRQSPPGAVTGLSPFTNSLRAASSAASATAMAGRAAVTASCGARSWPRPQPCRRSPGSIRERSPRPPISASPRIRARAVPARGCVQARGTVASFLEECPARPYARRMASRFTAGRRVRAVSRAFSRLGHCRAASEKKKNQGLQPVFEAPGFIRRTNAWHGRRLSSRPRSGWRCHFIAQHSNQTQPIENASSSDSASLRVTRLAASDPLARDSAASGSGWGRGAGSDERRACPFVDACMRRTLIRHRLDDFANARHDLMAVFCFAPTVINHLARTWRAPACIWPGSHGFTSRVSLAAGCRCNRAPTGINTIRIYNPVKQGRDQDPQGPASSSFAMAARRSPQLPDFASLSRAVALGREAGAVLDVPNPPRSSTCRCRAASARDKSGRCRRSAQNLGVGATRIQRKHRQPAERATAGSRARRSRKNARWQS